MMTLSLPEEEIFSNDIVFLQLLCANCGAGVTGSSLVENKGKLCETLPDKILFVGFLLPYRDNHPRVDQLHTYHLLGRN